MQQLYHISPKNSIYIHNLIFISLSEIIFKKDLIFLRICGIIISVANVCVAQLDRVQDSDSWGRGFKSCRIHHIRVSRIKLTLIFLKKTARISTGGSAFRFLLQPLPLLLSVFRTLRKRCSPPDYTRRRPGRLPYFSFWQAAV